MTDFSRNQIASVRMTSSQVDKWVIPNDRQLSLRARLGTGWSVRTNRNRYAYLEAPSPDTLSQEELQSIKSVIKKAETFEKVEKERIGNLVNNYESLKSRADGDGRVACALCGSAFSFRSHEQICVDCHKGFCLQCYVETPNSLKEKIILCKICSEKRELWKRSGAWFFGDIPPHSTPPPNDHSHHGDRSTRPLTPSPSPIPVRRNAQPVLAEPDRHSVASYEDRIQTYRPGAYSDSDSDESVAEDLSHLNLSRHNRDMDSLSMNSSHLRSNPLAAERISRASAQNSDDEQQESATESLQDLRSVSLQPQTIPDFISLYNEDSERLPVKKRAEVTFQPDVKETEITSHHEYERCESLPNVDLRQISFKDEEDNESPYGSLIFTLFYHELEEKLDIELMEAKHLPEEGSAHNPYVMINIVPSSGNARKQRSSTVYNSYMPQWKEKLTYFGISMDDLLVKLLTLSVMDERMIGHDVVIGEFSLQLRQLQCYQLTHYHIYLEKKLSLTANDIVSGEERGKILLSLRYNTGANQLHVGVVRCAALNIPSSDRVTDPYVKLYLQPDYSKSSKQKTSILKKTLNPEFHEEFIYHVDINSLTKRSLEITVWDHSMLGNALIGGVCLCLTSKLLTEKSQWEKTIKQPDRRHDTWHTLRDIVTR